MLHYKTVVKFWNNLYNFIQVFAQFFTNLTTVFAACMAFLAILAFLAFLAVLAILAIFRVAADRKPSKIAQF